jgi:glycosyltransferase involved in cell wall biosynthesis
MKIAVYTIALNESAHVERWASSAADADYRIVADTGSTDDTVERLTKAGVTAHRIAIRPWRFDDGRNAAMALIPSDADVCCAMDMDMYLEPGWRPKLEAAWTPGTTALWSSMALLTSVENPTPRKTYLRQFFHARWGYRFKRPVHEALVHVGEEVVPTRSDIVISHLRSGEPNHEKYLDLMDLGYREDPNDSQLCFWLARECMWANRLERAIELMKQYLAMPSSRWGEERSEAMRFLARMQPDQRLAWLDQARSEAPHRREIWLDLAEEFHGKADWLNLFWACTNGIEKSRRTGSYLDDPSSWGFRLFDLAAIAAWRLNAMDLAVQWGQKALELDRNNQRLKSNLDHFILRRDEVRTSA